MIPLRATVAQIVAVEAALINAKKAREAAVAAAELAKKAYDAAGAACEVANIAAGCALDGERTLFDLLKDIAPERVREGGAS